MWIYVKRPVGSIVGNVVVGQVKSSSPAALWRSYGSVSGLTKGEFFEYFNGIDQGVALVLGERIRLDVTLSLEDLREIDQDFHPPQFFARLRTAHPLHETVTKAAPPASTRRVRTTRKAWTKTAA